MKKNSIFLALALLVLLGACSSERYGDMQGTIDADGEKSLLYRMYVEPFAGQWNFVCYDILTKTIVTDADGTVRDQIQGRDTRQAELVWTFGTDGWGSIVLKKEPRNLPTGDSSPNGNFHPLLKYGKEFQWKVDNDSTMLLTFYLSDDATETYEARYDWNNGAETTDADEENPYWDDNLSLTVNYTATGSYAELGNNYAGYTESNDRYDGTGCTFTTDVTLTYYLQRN